MSDNFVKRFFVRGANSQPLRERKKVNYCGYVCEVVSLGKDDNGNEMWTIDTSKAKLKHKEILDD